MAKQNMLTANATLQIIKITIKSKKNCFDKLNYIWVDT